MLSKRKINSAIRCISGDEALVTKTSAKQTHIPALMDTLLCFNAIG